METPFLVVDNFYNKEEQNLIWTELDFHKENFIVDEGIANRGVAKNNNGKPIANLSRIYLDELYENKRERSSILHCYQKLFTRETFIHLSYFSVSNWQLDGSNNNQYLDLPVCLLGSDWLNAGGVSARWRQ